MTGNAAKPSDGPAFELNVTPMLDVLLVLLVIFMATVVQIHRSVDVTLPIPCAGACDGAPPIVLEVLPGPTYRVNRQPVANAQLLSYLRDAYQGRPEKIIQVAGDPATRYDDVIHAIDIAKSAGVVAVGIATKAPYVGR